MTEPGESESEPERRSSRGSGSEPDPRTDRQRESSSRSRSSRPANRSPEWPFSASSEREQPPRSDQPPRLGLRASPDTDVAEYPTEIHVWCDLPGCEEDTIDLSGDQWTLHVSAERSEEYWEEGGIHRRERSRYAERSIQLPTRSDIDAVEATFDDGVLLVRVPKHESAHTQTIGIE